jgi:hypothetical protein
MSLWRRIWCRLCHGNFHEYRPIYHSYDWRCTKCRHRWTEED